MWVALKRRRSKCGMFVKEEKEEEEEEEEEEEDTTLVGSCRPACCRKAGREAG
jgi:hypothetical protein